MLSVNHDDVCMGLGKYIWNLTAHKHLYILFYHAADSCLRIEHPISYLIGHKHLKTTTTTKQIYIFVIFGYPLCIPMFLNFIQNSDNTKCINKTEFVYKWCAMQITELQYAIKYSVSRLEDEIICIILICQMMKSPHYRTRKLD